MVVVMEPVLNPFSVLRRRAGLTLGEVAGYAQVDIRAVTRSEYGMYTNPLPSLVSFWVNRGAISEGQLVNDYEDYRLYKRRYITGRGLGELHFSTSSNIHPLRQLRASVGLGLVDFAKAFCVPLDTVQFFEKKKQRTIPKSLQEALNQAGYERSEIGAFQRAYSEWLTAQQSKVVFS